METASEKMQNLLESEETKRILEEGRLAYEFQHSRYYNFILDWAEKRCNTSLGKVRACVSSDPQVVTPITKRWQFDERWLIDFQEWVMGTAKNYEDLVRTGEQSSEHWTMGAPDEFPSDRDGSSTVTTG